MKIKVDLAILGGKKNRVVVIYKDGATDKVEVDVNVADNIAPEALRVAFIEHVDTK